MKTTTVPKPRGAETFAADQFVSAQSSQYNDSSRYSWYYEENTETQSQERAISISRFASVEVESNPITLRMLRDDDSQQTGE